MNYDPLQLKESIEKTSKYLDTIKTSIHTVIVGQEDLIEKLLIAILSDGHVFLEGLPGLGKTLTIKTLSNIIDTTF